MTNPAPRSTEIAPARTSQAAIDAGLRQFMISVYNYMASGLTLTGIVAYGAAETGLYASLIDTPMLFWGMTLAPLALVLLLSFRIEKMSSGRRQDGILGLCCPGRPVSFRDLLRLYRHEHCSNPPHHRRDLPRHEPLRLHHSRRSGAHRFVPIDGVGGHHHREHRKCIPRIFDCAAGYFGGWRHRVRRTDSALRRFIGTATAIVRQNYTTARPCLDRPPRPAPWAANRSPPVAS